MDKVIFRKWNKKHGGGIIAFLPDIEANPGMIMSYEHIGQHGGASLRIMGRPDTFLAKPEEYQELLAELKMIGYKPKAYKRLAR